MKNSKPKFSDNIYMMSLAIRDQLACVSIALLKQNQYCIYKMSIYKTETINELVMNK